MAIAQSVAEVLKSHVTLEVEGIDRMYLNLYVPRLQHERGVASFFRYHRGHQFASSALMAPMTREFVAQIETFVEAHGVPLITFEKGARKDDRMSAVAQNVVKQDALALAEYFASKPWPATGAAAASKADEASAMTAINSVVCTSCHLEQFQGDSSIPRLAGQQPDYLLKTMTDFRNRTRGNNPDMSDLMNTVTPEQVMAIANYLAGL